jgi:acyl phosphate:glycerol-3-phosphate acyltransferase
MALHNALILLGCYLLGALPFSVWIGKAFFKTDVRQHGSGNPGATNMLRTLGPGPALLVLFLDITKGVAAVLLAGHSADLALPIEKELGGFLAVVGHMYSPYLGFKGGKGVATTVGVMCVVNPLIGGISLALFLLVVGVSSYVSLASILMVTGYAVGVILSTYSDGINNATHVKSLLAVAMAGLVIFKHWSNIKRLREGTENKLNLRKNRTENK